MKVTKSDKDDFYLQCNSNWDYVHDCTCSGQSAGSLGPTHGTLSISTHSYSCGIYSFLHHYADGVLDIYTKKPL